MNSSWKSKKLGDLCKIELGKTPYRKQKSFWDSDKQTENVWLSIADLLNTTDKKVFESKEYISDKAMPLMKIVKKGTLLLSFKLTLGRLAFAGRDLFTNEAIAALNILQEEKIDKHYLYYFLTFFDWNAATEGDKKVKGRTLNKTKLKEIIVKFPESLEEQKHIVAILDQAFGVIDKAKVNTEQNLQNAKDLFESYSKKVFESSGKNWKKKTLGDVCVLFQGLAINAKTKHVLVEKSELPLLRIKDLKNNTEEQYVDPDNYPVNALINEEDLIYTRTGSLGLVFRGRKGVLHNNSFKIVPDNTLSKDFLFIWLQNPLFKSKILALAQRAAQPDITHRIFKKQIILVPPLEVQKQIVGTIDKMQYQIGKLENNYQAKVNDLDELRKSILRKAFTGEFAENNYSI